MTDFTVSRFGANNGAADKTELFLKVYGNEVLKYFLESTIMDSKHRVRTITSGKSAAFPVFGTTTAGYHTPGQELNGNSILSSERVINIDGLLISHAAIASIDELMSHFDIRADYARKLGHALAKKYDQQCLQVGVLAARSASTITGGNGGSVLTAATYGTDADVLAGGIFAAAQKLDEKNVPEEDRFCVLRPAQYYLLAQNTKVLNQDWGGKGAYSEGKVFRIAGVNILMSNLLPISNIAADSPAPANTYHANFSTTIGLVFQREAIGTVKLQDMAVETEYSARHQSTLMLAKIACGHGCLNPEAAVELKTA